MWSGRRLDQHGTDKAYSHSQQGDPDADPLKEVYSNSTGAYSYTYTTSAVRDYRVVFPTISVMWGSTSPSFASSPRAG